MEEQRFDGSELFTEGVSGKQIEEAILNPENKRVVIHKTGSVIKSKDGVFYRIDKNGARRKISDDEIIKALEIK